MEKLRSVIMEHPVHGMARVFERWVPCGHDRFRLEPVGVEFDLFCPPDEQHVLTEALRSRKLDSIVSVSASESHDGEIS